MKGKEENILLRKLVEAGDLNPSPSRKEFYTPHYEMIIAVGKDEHACLTISKEAYFELLENDEYIGT